MQRASSFLPVLLIVSLLRCLPADAQKSPSAAARPATVQGIVSNSITGEPVPHAHVQLMSVTGTQSAIYGAITTPTGHFSMNMVPAGSYFVQVYRVGFLPSSALQSDQINLQPEENLKDLRITLLPSAVISGHVLDEKDHPVANAAVQLMGENNNVGSQANDRGEFRIGGLAPGSYLVRALVLRTGPPEIRTDGTREINYQPTFYPASLLAAQAVPVQAEAGQETSDIDIKLKEAPIVRVSGQITGLPPGAEQVTVQIENEQVQNALINGDQFTIWRLAPGQHWLKAQCNAGGKLLLSASMPIQVAASSIENINLNVVAPFEVAGHINLDPLSADARDKLDSKMVTLVPVPVSFETQQAAVNANGDFVFKDLPAERYLVRISGFPDGVYVSNAESGPLKMQNGILDLSNGASGSNLAITLGTDGGTISGKLLRDQKLPRLLSVLLLSSTPRGYALLNYSFVGQDASYAFHNLAPGKYKLVAVNQIGSIDLDVLLALKHEVVEDVEIDSGESVSRDLRLSVPDRQ
jgi:hypothetical protein